MNREYRIKKRKEPTVSYGLIIYYVEKDTGDLLFLLQQRRDTFEYADFIHGIWQNENQLTAMFSLMSEEERSRIRNYTFQELWDDIWVDKTRKAYKESILRAKSKYESVRHLIPNLLDTTTTHVTSPPWEFPKGRKNHPKEPENECAIREAEEETRIPRILYSDNVKNYHDYTETYMGTNGTQYVAHYFLAESKECHIPQKYQTSDNIRKLTLSEEVFQIKWMKYKEACGHINPRRQTMLREIVTKKNQFPCLSDVKIELLKASQICVKM